MKKKKQQRKRGIAEEIQVSILSKVVIVFVIVAAVVTFMVGNISLSAQKNDLEMQSKAAAYQLELFFEEYTTVVEQMALNTDVKTLLEETDGSQYYRVRALCNRIQFYEKDRGSRQ